MREAEETLEQFDLGMREFKARHPAAFRVPPRLGCGPGQMAGE